MDVGSYLSGYTEGEGCFCVTFNRSCRHAFGWDIRPSFSISQNRDRSEILELFKTVFGCGTIRPDRSDKTLKYEVCSVADLVMKTCTNGVTTWPLSQRGTRRNCSTGEDAGYPQLDGKTP